MSNVMPYKRNTPFKTDLFGKRLRIQHLNLAGLDGLFFHNAQSQMRRQRIIARASTPTAKTLTQTAPSGRDRRNKA